MEEMTKRKLRAQKGQCKASFTRLKTQLEGEAKFTQDELKVRRINLVETYNSFKEIALHLQLLGETATEEDEIEERYLYLMATLEERMNQSPHGDPLKAINNRAKLPALEIPIFDGKNVAAYKPFSEMFQAIVHNDSRISDIERLCFLKKYLRGEPLQLIDNLPIIGISYESALDLLRKRYDNPALLVNNHVTSLLDLCSINRGTAQQLRDFIAKVRQHISALKNLSQPIGHWDAMLSCILVRKLDSFTVRLFHSDRDNTKVVQVDELLNFLEKRAASLEASPTMSEKSQGKVYSVNIATFNKIQRYAQCIMCSEDHKLYRCPLFKAESPQKRNEYVVKNNLCQLCLTLHTQKCRYNFQCYICNSRLHNTLIHIDEKKPALEAKENEQSQLVNLHTSQSVADSVLLPTAKVLVTGANNKRFVVRALLDCGSQTSFCTTALAKELELPSIDMHKNIGTLGGTCNNFTNKGIHLRIDSLVNSFQLNVTCSVINKITSELPQKHIDLSGFIIPKHVALADSEFHIPGQISLLLASDVFFKIILDGKIEGGPTDPILLNTQLGYIISSTSISNYTAVTMHTVIHPLQNNTFQVKYPLKLIQDIDPSNSYAIALQRLYNLENKFQRDPVYFNLYKNFIHTICIINTKTCDPKNEPLFILPHHGVLRPERKPNKLRVVFDGSTKTRGGLSLKDLMCNGPVVQHTLFDILLLYKYTLQYDIRHMYRMIFIHPEHRCLQNILWRENGVLNVLQLQTVTYGLTSSAYLATRCLIEFLQQLWQHNLEWDTPLPIELNSIWDSFYTNLVDMPELIIPRYVQTGGADEVDLIGFCDASATGCVILFIYFAQSPE